MLVTDFFSLKKIATTVLVVTFFFRSTITFLAGEYIGKIYVDES